MKKVSLVLLLILTAVTAHARPRCSAIANQKLNQALPIFGLPSSAKVELLPPDFGRNSFGEKVIIYTASAIKISEGSYLPDGAASIIIRAKDCAPVKVIVDIFSGMHDEE